MGGLLTLLLFAGVFYLMMRWGCGAHMVHGRGGHGGQGDHCADGVAATHLDPVCGMKVDPKAGYGKMYEGRLYRFCSRGCLDKFEAEPTRYAQIKEST